jgi:mRNA-degrading endonuclease RelE of RelBE toxin-antitoxin system
MTYEEKLDKILFKLTEERKLTRKGHKTKVKFNDRSFTKIEVSDIYRILLKLQDDEKALTIVESLTPIDHVYPDYPNNSIAHPNDYDLVNVVVVELDDKFDKWLMHKKKIEQAINSVFSNTAIDDIKNKPKSKSIYQIKYGADQRIILNNLFELSKPNFDSENANVFDFLYNNPNKKYTLQEIESSLDQKLTKNLSKIVENLGFTKDLKKVFFQVSKTSIIFHNPISQKRMNNLDFKIIKL